jgi:hypothetical protein
LCGEYETDGRFHYLAGYEVEDPDGQLLYVTKTALPVIDRGEAVDPIRILVEPV